MNNFQYSRAQDIADAVRQSATDDSARFIAGGTNLIDLMKYEVERPARLIDISHRRAGAEFGPRMASSREGSLSPSGERHSRGGVDAVTQHGLERWQSAATNALPVFL